MNHRYVKNAAEAKTYHDGTVSSAKLKFHLRQSELIHNTFSSQPKIERFMGHPVVVTLDRFKSPPRFRAPRTGATELVPCPLCGAPGGSIEYRDGEPESRSVCGVCSSGES